jgi:hypothetical protein
MIPWDGFAAPFAPPGHFEVPSDPTHPRHVVVDRKGLPLRLALTGGHQHDSQIAPELLHGLRRKDICWQTKPRIQRPSAAMPTERMHHASTFENG